MTLISSTARAFAEEPEAEISEPVPPEARVLGSAFCMYLSGFMPLASVSRVRTTEAQLDQTIDEVRQILRPRHYRRAVWIIGPACRPENLPDLLIARGFVAATAAPFEPVAHSMVLVTEPPPSPAGVEARLARSYEEYRDALRIAAEVFNMSSEESREWLEASAELWKQQDGVQRMTFVVLVDDRPIGFAFAAASPNGLMLCGAGVLPSERRRGAYRALLAARWTRAVELGTPTLVIHASSMSRPILEQCGFETICRISLFEDPFVG